MAEKSLELIVSTLNAEMNRYWTRFNIFSAVQIGAVIGLVSKATFLVSNSWILRFTFLLIFLFSGVGAFALTRGYDLEKALLKTLEEYMPRGKNALISSRQHSRWPFHCGAIVCCLFAWVCFFLWPAVWIVLECLNFPIKVSS